jgi:hypothetical protein
MDWSYFTGFFDGEGCVTITKTQTGIQFRLFVAASKREQLEPCAEFLRSQDVRFSWRIDKRNGIGWGHSGACLVISRRKSLRIILEKVVPFLVLKQPQCEILGRALDLQQQLKIERKVILQNLQGFDSLRRELHQHNHKGPRLLKEWK